MNKKVHYGLQLRSRDLRQVLDQFGGVHEKATEILEGREATFLAVTATSRIDRVALYDLPGYSTRWSLKGHSPFSSARAELKERQAKVKGYGARDPDVDFDVTFRFWLSRDTGTFIGYVDAMGAAEFRELLIGAGFAEEFPYWDKGRPAEGFTPERWAARGAIWNDVLTGGSGAWLDLSTPQPGGNHEVSQRVLAEIPTLEQRVALHADVVAFKRVLAANAAKQGDVGQGGSSDFSMTEYLTYANRLDKGDEEVSAIYREAVEQVRDRLAPEITKSMLTAR